MNVLLLSGLGPEVKYEDLFDGTILSSHSADDPDTEGREILQWKLSTSRGDIPLLRTRNTRPPHLTTAVVTEIFTSAGCDVEHLDLSEIWADKFPNVSKMPDIVALSTTFICNFKALFRAINWIGRHFPETAIIVGGQFSNLKAREIINRDRRVLCVIRGDAEVSVRPLILALQGKLDYAYVPNLLIRHPATSEILETSLEYVDINACDTVNFSGEPSVVPYESMRGCPFLCGFCSFPAASPKWRYKSVDRMLQDFTTYQAHGVRHIRAMDSTFSVPGNRFRDFLSAKSKLDLTWECYSRANAVASGETVAALENSGLTAISIGFESMSDRSLKLMNKGVASRYNRAAADVLAQSEIATRVSFMVGYPGETAEDFEKTYDFLVKEFPLRYMISVFSPLDETMPVWRDQDVHKLAIVDDNDEAPVWEHCGMTSREAEVLLRKTVVDARWKNDAGTHLLWQAKWEFPFAPELSRSKNQRIEKLLERYVFARRDLSNDALTTKTRHSIKVELRSLNVIS